MPFVYKSSVRPGPIRTSGQSPRGIGMVEGLAILKEVRETYGCPVLTDVHLPEQCEVVAEAVDVLQIPAFLCRQTDLLLAAADTGKPINVEEGPVSRALGHAPRGGEDHRRRQWSGAGVRAGRKLRLQHADLGHAEPAAAGGDRLPGGVRRNAFSSATGRAGLCQAAGSGSSCPCSRGRRLRSASPRCLWRHTGSLIRRSPTAPTWCRWMPCPRCSTGCLAFDALAKNS